MGVAQSPPHFYLTFFFAHIALLLLGNLVLAGHFGGQDNLIDTVEDPIGGHIVGEGNHAVVVQDDDSVGRGAGLVEQVHKNAELS